MSIKSVLQDSRVNPPVLRARLARGEDGHLRLLAPAVGVYRGAPEVGALVAPDRPVGAIEILGVVHHVLAPAGAVGLVVSPPGPATRRPVDFDEPLLTLDPEAAHAAAAAGPAGSAATGAVSHAGAAVVRAPTSGRFYVRPGPGKPVFISVGAVVEQGQTVGLIEVMKTFSRLLYGGDGLPARARVRAILLSDESDVAAGDPLIEVEPVGEDTANSAHDSDRGGSSH